MIIYFDLQPEFREKLAVLLGSTESNLEPFYAELESEVAWHLALGGLRESELSDDVIFGQLKDINQAVAALDDALDEMSPDVFGWLIDYAPVGLDYQMPFRVVKKPLKVIKSMTKKALKSFKGRDMTARRSTSADFIRKIASCCEKIFGSRPDLESELFYNIVYITFEALAISEHKDIEALIKQAMRPPAVVLSDDDEKQKKTEITVPENYLRALKE